jgi:hypothetical protein
MCKGSEGEELELNTRVRHSVAKAVTAEVGALLVDSWRGGGRNVVSRRAVSPQDLTERAKFRARATSNLSR